MARSKQRPSEWLEHTENEMMTYALQNGTLNNGSTYWSLRNGICYEPAPNNERHRVETYRSGLLYDGSSTPTDPRIPRKPPSGISSKYNRRPIQSKTEQDSVIPYRPTSGIQSQLSSGLKGKDDFGPQLFAFVNTMHSFIIKPAISYLWGFMSQVVNGISQLDNEPTLKGSKLFPRKSSKQSSQNSAQPPLVVPWQIAAALPWVCTFGYLLIQLYKLFYVLQNIFLVGVVASFVFSIGFRNGSRGSWLDFARKCLSRFQQSSRK